MSRLPGLLFVLVLSASGCGLMERGAGDGTALELFDGESLDGWHIENGGRFSVRDGLIVLDGGTGWLRSDVELEDFVLEIEWRFLEDGANSGIFVRTAATSHDDENGWPDNGYQVQCMNTVDGERPCGIMIPYGGGDFEHSSDVEAIRAALSPTGEWNRYEITVIGDTITVSLNDVVVTTAQGIRNQRGHVGIQGEHGHLEFRKFRARVIDG